MDDFDYIIVGGGTAGCVLANRLTEDGRYNVCMLEAGRKDRNWLIHIPLGITFLKNHKILNWRFKSVPQEGAAGRQIFVPRGKTLGGSSSINGMVYMRGHSLDYDEWAEMGNPGWSFAEVLPYYLKSENNHSFGGPYHGKGGLLDVAHHEFYSPLTDMMETAARELQYPVTPDFNGVQTEGFGRRQVTVRNGRRASASTAFLRPALKRSNLTVITDATVDKVVLSGRAAIGVEAIIAGTRHRLTARREIILAAGSVASPPILLRSGLGDAAELQRMQIPVLHNLLGVGRNLQDHFLSALFYETESTITYGISPSSAPWWVWQAMRYVLFKKGIFANNIVHSGGDIRSDPSQNRPDLGFSLMPAKRTDTTQVSIGHGYGMMFYPLRPEARGVVSVSSVDPMADPLIDFRVLTGPQGDKDMALLLKGLYIARRLMSSPAWDAVRGVEVGPGPSITERRELSDYIRRTLTTAFHPVGTCKMGPDPSDAVVDHELKVHGVERLRVVDASIMPRITGSNTMAPTIMIAEKAADMMLGKPALPPIQLDPAFSPRSFVA
jgi:choline dehydrogenase